MSRRVIFLALTFASVVSTSAAPPAWWTLRGATDANPPNAAAAVNQGQLKHFTQKAVQELNTRIPGGAGTDLNGLVTGWVQAYQAGGHNASNPLPADFQAMNSGQLKWIANKIHARLVFAKYEDAVPTWLAQNPATDHQLVNLGQLKTVFNFDLTAPTGQLPEWWQKFYFNGQMGIDANGDADGDGLSNAQELAAGADPIMADTDHDGMPDGLELAVGFDITDADENNNGESDGYEDYDDDSYVNFAEVLAGTGPQDATKKPDGTSTDTLLVTTFGVEFEKRSAPLSKFGYQGFIPSPLVDDDGKIVGNGYKRFLNAAWEHDQKETLDYSYWAETQTYKSSSNETFVPSIVQNPNGQASSLVTYSSSSSISNWFYSYQDVDSLTTFALNTESTGWYDHNGNSGGDNWFFATLNSGNQTTTWEYPEYYPTGYHIDGWSWPNTETIVDVVKESSTTQTMERRTKAETAEGSYYDKATYTNEYTDSQLKQHSEQILESVAYRAPYNNADPCWARFSYAYGRDSVWTDDVRYNLKADVGSNIRKVVFLWREVSKADPHPSAEPIQSKEPVDAEKWMNETVELGAGTGTSPNTVRTSTYEITHPPKGGIRYPAGTSGIQLTVPSLIAVDHDVLPAGLVPRTLHPISFNVGTDLNKQNVSLVPSTNGKLKLWKRVTSPAISGNAAPEAPQTYELQTLPYSLKVEEKSGNQSKTEDFFLQGEAAGDVTLKLMLDTLELRSATIKIVELDLDVDSDNTGQISHSSTEDQAESDSTQPGKMVISNPNGDADGNGKPNHADLDNAGMFTKIDLKAENLSPTDRITFRYLASDPGGIKETTDPTTAKKYYASPSGQFRIWKKDGNASRGTGDYISPGFPYTLGDLNLNPGSHQTFYVEIMSGAVGQCTIEVSTSAANDIVTLLGVDVQDNTIATGVDRTSITSNPFSVGHQDKFWIMAPSGVVPAPLLGAGGDCSNATKFLLQFATPMELKMEWLGAMRTQGAILPLNVPEVDSEWHGTSTTTAESPPFPAVTWTMGKPGAAKNPVDLPIAIKTMKNRVVRVKLYLVDLMASDGSPRELDTSLIPTAEALRTHLNGLFAPQINVWFDVSIERDINGNHNYENYLVDPRTDGDNAFNLMGPEVTSVDQQKVLDKTHSSTTDADIRIFLISSLNTFPVQFGTNVTTAYGSTNHTAATCWIWGLPETSLPRTDKTYDEIEEVLSSIGHEVGHVLVGYGHPNISDEPGLAPLAGTDRTVRLMCSRENRSPQNGKLLVKAEWDEAERWLKEHVDIETP